MDKDSHKELKNLIEQYPYFEVAHLLLLKNLNDLQSIRFKEELKSSTLHIANRRQLYLLLNDRLKIIPYSKAFSQFSDEKLKIENDTEILQKLKPEDVKDDLFELSDHLKITSNKEIDEQAISKNSREDVEILELTDLNQKNEEHKEKVSESNQVERDITIVPEEVYPIEFGGSLYTLNEDSNLDEKNHNQENHSFTDWMNVVDRSENLPDSESVDANSAKKKNFDLIDNFIQNEPSIKRNIKVADKQEDISLDSIRENDGFMSETLASIYVKQRLFDKAVAVYRKLELKNPEKKAYFASQIEKIEKLKNSK
jgi:hypothetical protein